MHVRTTDRRSTSVAPRAAANPHTRRGVPVVVVAVGLAGLWAVSACKKEGEGSQPPKTSDQELLDAELGTQDPVERAGGLVLTGKPAEGLAEADAALAKDPDNHELHYVRGMALQALGRGDDAIAAWERALQIQPKLAAAHDGIGSVLLDAGRAQEAIPRFEQAIALANDFVSPLYNLGLALVTLERPKDALVPLERAYTLAPEDIDVLTQLALAEAMVGVSFDAKDDKRAAYFAKAVEHIHAAVDRAPTDPFVHAAHAEVAVIVGKLDGAVTARETIVALTPNDPQAYLDLVRALVRAGRAAEAEPALAKAEALAPGSAIVASDRGLVLATLGKVDDALAAFDVSLQREPALVSAHRRRVEVLVEAGRCKQAQDALAAWEPHAKDAVAKGKLRATELDADRARVRGCKARR
jgi:tetratricopeptide (TPR) repeat protein